MKKVGQKVNMMYVKQSKLYSPFSSSKLKKLHEIGYIKAGINENVTIYSRDSFKLKLNSLTYYTFSLPEGDRTVVLLFISYPRRGGGERRG
jgi:hypothetical protein